MSNVQEGKKQYNGDIELGGYNRVIKNDTLDLDHPKKKNTFHFDVSFYVKQGDKKKVIVNKVADVIQSGQMLAIMVRLVHIS